VRRVLPLLEEPDRRALPVYLPQRLARQLAGELGLLLGREVSCSVAGEKPSGPDVVWAKVDAGGLKVGVLVGPVSFAHAVCDVLLGGEPLPGGDASPLTDGEAAVLEEFFHSAGRAVAAAAGASGSVVVEAVEVLPRQPAAEWGEVSFAVSAPGMPGARVAVVFFAPVSEDGRGLGEAIGFLPVVLSVVSARLWVPLGEVARLGRGDLLLVDVADPFAGVLESGSVPLFECRCGRLGSSLAALLVRAQAGGGVQVRVDVPDLSLGGVQEGPPLGMESLSSLPVSLTVEVGRVTKRLAEVAALRPGDVVPLNRPASSLVDVLANGVLVARGEVVDAGGQYAVRIVEVASPAAGGGP